MINKGHFAKCCTMCKRSYRNWNVVFGVLGNLYSALNNNRKKITDVALMEKHLIFNKRANFCMFHQDVDFII